MSTEMLMTRRKENGADTFTLATPEQMLVKDLKGKRGFYRTVETAQVNRTLKFRPTAPLGHCHEFLTELSRGCNTTRVSFVILWSFLGDTTKMAFALLKVFRTGFVRIVGLGVALISLASVGMAQLAASPPLADPNDHRFVGVTEDFETPALSGSHLMPTQPLALIDDSHPGYVIQLVDLQWRWGDPLHVYVIKPVGVKNPPVILNLYGYPADTDAYKNETFQKDLVKDGFAAVGFVSALTGQRYHDRPLQEWFLSDLQECLATTAHDVQMLLNYLTARGDLDMSRVAMFGQGSGASIAILASAVDSRIKVLDVLDPWGDWPTWMATSPFVPQDERPNYVKPDFLMKVASLETLTWMPQVKAKKFRLQQNLFEADTPTPVKEKIRTAVPAGTTVVVYKTFAEFAAAFPHSNNLGWIKHELQSLPQAPAPASDKSQPERR